MKLLHYLLFVTFILFFQPIRADTIWQEYGTQNNITGYSRSLSGSRYLIVKGVTTIHVALPVIGNVLRDIQGFPKWIKNQKQSELILEVDPHNFVIYSVFEFGWPLKPRDVAFKSLISVDAETGDLLVTSTIIKEPLKPLRKDYIRLNEFYQQFVLTCLEKDKTKVTFILRIDPSVNVPSYWVNTGLKKSVFEILSGLREIVTSQQYHTDGYFSPVNIELTRNSFRARLKHCIADTKTIETIVLNNQLIEVMLNSRDLTDGLNRIEKLIQPRQLALDNND